MDEWIEQWVLTYGPRAVNYAISMVRDRSVAEDLVQDALCALLRNRDRYDLERDGTKLLFTAVTNKCRNYVTRRRPLVSLDAGEALSGARELADERRDLDPLQCVAAGELAALVEHSLAELPDRQREVLHLSATGWEIPAIAEALGLKRNHTRVLLHRARRAVARALELYFDEVRE